MGGFAYHELPSGAGSDWTWLGEPTTKILLRRRHPPMPSLNSDLPEPSFELSEIFSSVQGEGASAGKPALFVRLAVCNLRCGFCDTKYSWDFKTYRYEEEVRSVSLGELAARITQAGERRVVVTGGEPLLQQAKLAKLFSDVPEDIVIEVETNGTLLPQRELLARVDQWNVSAKLAHSGEPPERRLNFEALAALRDSGRAYLKLVVRGAEDLPEVHALVRESAFAPASVLLMPEATTRLEYASRARLIEELSRAHGFGFSPRLHVAQWDGMRGR